MPRFLARIASLEARLRKRTGRNGIFWIPIIGPDNPELEAAVEAQAKAAGWEGIICAVIRPLDPEVVERIRLLEAEDQD